MVREPECEFLPGSEGKTLLSFYSSKAAAWAWFRAMCPFPKQKTLAPWHVEEDGVLTKPKVEGTRNHVSSLMINLKVFWVCGPTRREEGTGMDGGIDGCGMVPHHPSCPLPAIKVQSTENNAFPSLRFLKSTKRVDKGFVSLSMLCLDSLQCYRLRGLDALLSGHI